jgi:hypothetical protein
VKLFRRRRRRLPAERRPPIEPEERIVAWAGATDDEVVVVTNHGIWLPGATARLGWHEIHKATWSGRQLALVASREVGDEEGYAIVADQPAIVHTLLDPDNAPLQVRVRVTRSIAYTQVHPLPDGGAVRVVARRVPGIDGLSWTVRYEDGADPTDERIRALTEELVAYGKASVAGARP